MSEEEQRFLDIYRRYLRQVHAYCARRAPSSQVQDAVAETFLVAWRRIDQLPDPDTALPWLYGTAYRVLSHQWRQGSRLARLHERLGGLVGVDQLTPEVLVLSQEEHQTVLQAAARLRPIDQEILRLTLWEELTYAEVARVLDIPADVAKQRAYRARINLAKRYDELTRERRPPAARKGGVS
jgi:RNA polymerase sigma factor (sigma-70 family)